MDARQALTWSCNTYFATVAGTLAPGELRTLLAPTGLLSQTGLAKAKQPPSFAIRAAPTPTALPCWE